MKTDAYTKVILTIIASCLLYSTVKDIISPAYAATMDVNIVGVGGVWPGYPLRVTNH